VEESFASLAVIAGTDRAELAPSVVEFERLVAGERVNPDNILSQPFAPRTDRKRHSIEKG
jgi:hypothetical protein